MNADASKQFLSMLRKNQKKSKEKEKAKYVSKPRYFGLKLHEETSKTDNVCGPPKRKRAKKSLNSNPSSFASVGDNLTIQEIVQNVNSSFGINISESSLEIVKQKQQESDNILQEVIASVGTWEEAADQQLLMENAAHIQMEKSTSKNRHQTRMENIEEDWETHREELLHAFIKGQADCPSKCVSCCTSLDQHIVKCYTCCNVYCDNCDEVFHSKTTLHNRVLLKDRLEKVLLLPTQFVDFSSGCQIVTKDIAVPCIVPSSCKVCKKANSMGAEATKDFIIVVTTDGRFDLNGVQFRCSTIECRSVQEVTASDFVASGFWPGSPTRTAYLFSTSVMLHWFHLKHKTPGTSEMKYVELLEAVSKDAGRMNVISRVMFNRASREFSYIQHQIDITVKKRDKMKCMACGNICLAAHPDGDFKLMRFKSAKSGYSKSLFGDAAIADDSVVQEHIDYINTRKAQKKGHNSCGNSTYKAGRESSTRFGSLDETALGSACCRHGTILLAANMYRGESYRFIHYFQKELLSKGYLFFCYDVVCHYWIFAKSVAELFPENDTFREMVERQIPFLPVLHGKTHVWDCQVLNNGRWKLGAAATAGEEQEQGFQRFSRYGTVTKHMSSASRRDHLTEAIFYFNQDKENGMVYALAKRLKRAYSKVEEYGTNLRKLLCERGLTEDELPNIKTQLQKLAREKQNPSFAEPDPFLKQLPEADGPETAARESREKRKKLPQSYKTDLEGLFMTIAWARKMMETYANSTKSRDRFRNKMECSRRKAFELIDLINEQTTYNITEEMFDSAYFPWNETSEINLTANYRLIDTWMMGKRFQEEIYTTKKEMVEFINCLKKKRSTLLRNRKCEEEFIKNQKESHLVTSDCSIRHENLLARGKIVLIKEEMMRLDQLLADSVAYFSGHIQIEVDEDDVGEEDHDEDYASEIEDELVFDTV